jgi:hypothetical protein
MRARERVVRSVLSLLVGLTVIPVAAIAGDIAAGIFLHSHFREFGQATDAVGSASLLASGRLSVLLSGFVVGAVAGRYEVLHCAALVAVLIGVGVRWAHVNLPKDDLNIAILAALCLVGGCLAWLLRRRRLRRAESTHVPL